MDIKFRVRNQELRRVTYDTIVANSQDYLYAEFEFVTEDWDGVTKYVYFSDPAKTSPILLQLDEGNRVRVPSEMIAMPSFMVNLVGSKGTMTISTNWLMLAVTGSGIIDGFAPTPSENPIINSKLDKSVFEEYKEETTGEIGKKLDKSVFDEYKLADTEWKANTTEDIGKKLDKSVFVEYKEETTGEIGKKLDKSVFVEYKSADTEWKEETLNNIRDTYATKESISSVYNPKGSVETFDDLPKYGNTTGDVYNVRTAREVDGRYYPAGTNYAYVKDDTIGGYRWDALGGFMDMSEYADREEVQNYINMKADEMYSPFYVDGYNNDTGEITISYDEAKVTSVTYDSDTGIMTME